MSKIFRTAPLTLNTRAQQSQMELVGQVVDTAIDFGLTPDNTTHSNILRWYATGTSPGVANTQFTVSHNLKHIPWHVFWAAEDGSNIYYSLYATWTAATNSAQGSVFLKSTGVSTTYHVIII